MKDTCHKQKCPANQITAHRTNRSYAQKMLKALEDPEQRAQGHAGGCPGEHAQSQVTVIVSVPLADDDLVGRLLSINSCIRVLVWHCICLPVGGIDNLSSCGVCAAVWTIAVDLEGDKVP